MVEYILLHVLTVYGTASGITLEQKCVNNKTNEILVFQEILDYLNVKGNIITADAMHCQKETCRKIVENGGDYVFGLKGNQRCTYEEAKLFLEDHENFSSPLEKEHGRIEHRICKKIKDISWLGDEWSGIKSMFPIRRISEENHHKFDETHYYLNIKGNIIPADAMHCQKETCRKIVENGGDYVFGLKGNQRCTYEESKLFLEVHENEELIEEFVSPLEKEHDRIEQRICKKIKDIS